MAQLIQNGDVLSGTSNNSANILYSETDGSSKNIQEKIGELDNEVGELNNNLKFSKDENKIGVWIDNKPIYRRVIEFTITNLEMNIDLSSLNMNVNDITNLYGFYIVEGWYIPYNSLQHDGYTRYLTFNKFTNILYSKLTEESSLDRKAFCVIEYTKTTD